MNIDFEKVGNVIKMASLIVGLIGFGMMMIVLLVRGHFRSELSDEINRPWEKAERKAARKAARAERKIRRRISRGRAEGLR